MSGLIVTCRAHAKSTGDRCRRAPVPFTTEAGVPLCHIHGGWSPAVLRRANGAFREYVEFGSREWEPTWLRNEKIQAKLRSDKRREARHLKREQKKLARTHGIGAATALPPIPYEGFENFASDWDFH